MLEKNLSLDFLVPLKIISNRFEIEQDHQQSSVLLRSLRESSIFRT